MTESNADNWTAEKSFEFATAAGEVGLWILDVDTDQFSVSPPWKAMLGYKESDAFETADDWYKRVHPTEIPYLKSVLDSHLQGFTDSFEIEHRILNRQGEYEWVLCRGKALRDGKSRAYRILGSQINISRYKQNEKRMSENALHDPITGLSSRILFMEYLQRARAIIRRYKERHFAVFSMGIDQFGRISERLGSAAGNQFLCEVASRLKSMLRPNDVLARLDGDVFAVLVEDFPDISHSVRIAERIKQVISMPMTLNGEEIACRASIGIVVSDSGYSHTEEFLQNAETAMRRAREMGRDRYEIYDKAVQTQAMAHAKLEAELRAAIERNDFSVHYQPIVSMKTGALVSCEAFLRWRHPELGFVPAADFIHVVEETGLIIFLGNQVLKTACEQAKIWHMAGLPRIGISVNISAFQFKQKNLQSIVTDVLKESRLEPQYLRLELSEKAAMENAEFHMAALQSLKDLGLRLSLDDFGTGYSSLEYLERFPFDQLKIDLSIIRGIPQKADSKAIASAIISLAHSLNLEVIAEGVETMEQLEFLKEKGCDLFQGSLFSMPVDNEQITRILDRSKTENGWQYMKKKTTKNQDMRQNSQK